MALALPRLTSPSDHVIDLAVLTPTMGLAPLLVERVLDAIGVLRNGVIVASGEAQSLLHDREIQAAYLGDS